ncbi:diphthine synthase [Cuniculiplasma sp. SKW4]|uniref:diphthine synthase n=1 Tax=Cuniculiplasma sp. SKW4 TaxID=3400171 RepID=UPI003FD51752
MNLNLIGSGLRGIRSITLEEMEILRESDVIYIDSYTSIFEDNFQKDLESLAGKKSICLSREEVESFSFLNNKFENISFVVSGDPFTSTTHYAIINECRKKGINYRIYENSSITGAIAGRTGLSPYRIGIVVSIPRIYHNYIPVSPIKKIMSNIEYGLHTTLLMDLENGKNMEPSMVLKTLEKMEERTGVQFIRGRPAISLERLGWKDERIDLDFLDKILENDLMSPYTIVIPSRPDANERENMIGIFGRDSVDKIFGTV